MNISLLHTTLIVCAFVLVSSCSSYEIVSPATVVSSSQIVTVQGRDKALRIDLTPIKEAVSNSSWHSDTWPWCTDCFIDKGSYHLELKNAPDVYVSIYGAYFWIEGQKGYYKVSDSESDIFQKFFDDLKEKEKIKWQVNNR